MFATTTFLIADDSGSYRAILRQLIRNQPGWYVVGEVSDGIAAVRLAVRYRPDVVFMDVAMPLMNGIEATQRIKRSVPHAHVIIFSGFDDDEFLYESRSVGASYYLRKEDLDAEALKQLIEEFCR